jgi:DNA-binding LacI/PurR family transcriptional regulator
VSQATVSNAVNGYRPVSEDARRRVQQAIDELGYAPNLSARHLRSGRTGLVALAIPELDNPYFAELAGAAFREAAARGYTLLLDYTDADREKELLVSDGFRTQLIDGLIMSPVRLDRRDLIERRSGTPLVLIGESVHGTPYDHVAIDNLAASRDAVAHLAGLGRTRIAFIGARPDDDREPAHLRLRGYREGLSAAGLRYDPALVVSTSAFGRADGAEGLRRLFDSAPEPPDAVFGYNDPIALGAMWALRDRRLRVPRDVAVVGFDDVEEGRYSNPTLTTISPDKAAIARRAVEMLIERIEGRVAPAPREIQPPYTLIVRESA